MLRLRVTPASGAPFTRAVEAASLTIGRARDADLTLQDRFLSRRHARLFYDGDRLLIEDLGSQNGTFVNGDRVEEPVELRPGDEVRLSASALEVEDASGEARPPSTATALFRPVREILENREAPPPASEANAETLRRYAERLRLVNEVHQALAQSLGLEEVLELILDRVFDHLRPEEATLYLEGPDGELRPAGSRPPEVPGEERFFSRSLAREVTEEGLAALVVDARTDERFAGAESILLSGVRSIAAAPLLTPEGCQGMIALSSRLHVRRFDEGDLELLVSLASVAALHVRNLALAEEAAERRRMAEELALARRIQVSLLPAALPEVPGWELHGGSVPSREASGDYYLVAHREEAGDCVVMVVDVSGKGIAAALLTASVEALAAGFLELGLPPAEVCDRVCRRLFDRTPPERYATAFLAALEPGSGRVRWANAGHNAGLVVRSGGTTETLDSTGPPLGLVPGARREGAELHLEPGDLLVLYTDGITEAVDPDDEEYGLERLAGLCSNRRDRPLEELSRALEEDLARFAREVPFHDDRTVVLARRAEG